MGFRHAAVLSAVSFCLGVLFINFNVDRRILYGGGPPSEEDYADATKYYTAFYEAPLAIKALLHAVMGIGLLSLIAKLGSWDDSAKFFDGTSIGMFLAGIVIYVTVGIPTLHTVAEPYADDSLADQREALAVLSAANTLIIICLLGVLLMQAGQEYTRRDFANAVRKIRLEDEKAAAAAGAAGAEEKKDQ